jgi:hypothetical protein
MKFVYTTSEPEYYNFRKLGGTLLPDMSVSLNDAAYKRFVEETQHTTHNLVLTKTFGENRER